MGGVMKEIKSNYRILYVEDEEKTRKNYVSFLSRYYNTIYEASDAEEALFLYQKQEPSILVIDINLPKKSGLEFLKEIRQNDPATKAIILSAKSDLESLLGASELKLTKYLVKPVSRKELQDALELAIKEIEAYSIVAKKIVKMKGNFTWDMKYHILKDGEVEQKLTKKEGELLSLFFSNLNKIFSSEDIIFELWYDTDVAREDTLKTLIKGLRKKLPDGSIKNIFGVGYRLKF